MYGNILESFLERIYLFQMIFNIICFVLFSESQLPVVLVSLRLGYNNNKSRFSGSEQCNAVTAWVEVRNIKCPYSSCGSNEGNFF